LTPITGPPPGPTGDGGVLNDAGAGGANGGGAGGGPAGGAGGTSGPAPGGGAGGAGAGGTGPTANDAAPPVDAPITAGDVAQEGPPSSATPPSLTRCSDYMHTVAACDLTTGV